VATTASLSDLQQLHGHGGLVFSPAFSPSGRKKHGKKRSESARTRGSPRAAGAGGGGGHVAGMMSPNGSLSARGERDGRYHPRSRGDEDDEEASADWIELPSHSSVAGAGPGAGPGQGYNHSGGRNVPPRAAAEVQC
jgi:hypothetical protein